MVGVPGGVGGLEDKQWERLERCLGGRSRQIQ